MSSNLAAMNFINASICSFLFDFSGVCQADFCLLKYSWYLFTISKALASFSSKDCGTRLESGIQELDGVFSSCRNVPIQQLHLSVPQKYSSVLLSGKTQAHPSDVIFQLEGCPSVFQYSSRSGKHFHLVIFLLSSRLFSLPLSVFSQAMLNGSLATDLS